MRRFLFLVVVLACCAATAIAAHINGRQHTNISSATDVQGVTSFEHWSIENLGGNDVKVQFYNGGSLRTEAFWVSAGGTWGGKLGSRYNGYRLTPSGVTSCNTTFR